MGDQTPESGESPAGEMSQDELEAQTGAALPWREVLSMIDASIAAPLDAAWAANVLADDAPAVENAEYEPEVDPES